MKITKVIYFKTFPIGAYWEKLGIEIELSEEDDNPRSCFYEAKKIVENFHYESNKAAEKEKDWMIDEALDAISTNRSTMPPEERITKQINEIKDLTVLKSFALIARNYPSIKEVYDNKLKELSS